MSDSQTVSVRAARYWEGWWYRNRSTSNVQRVHVLNWSPAIVRPLDQPDELLSNHDLEIGRAHNVSLSDLFYEPDRP